MKRRDDIILLAVWMFILITPYLIGFLISDQKNVFLGFLINPIDGLSYLAKMNQGAGREWLFHLPYSSITHTKVFLFSFYLLIGKISNLLFADLRIGFHFFRLIGSFFFYHQLILLVNENFKIELVSRFLKISVLFGGGLGWLFVLSGDIPADLWVSEAFPFLSAFVNPHFILSLGLLLYVLRVVISNTFSSLEKVKLGLTAFILVNISPFAVVIGGIILITGLAWDYFEKRKVQAWGLLIYGLVSTPILLYQYWIVQTIEPLRSWNAQNLTPAPSLLNFLFSFSPFFIFNMALMGWLFFKRIALNKLQFVLISWQVLAFIFVYFPFDLQRRFMVGYHLVTTLLFFSFVTTLSKQNIFSQSKLKRFLIMVLILIIPSNLLLITGSINATVQKDENLFISTNLIKAYDWLDKSGIANGVVLSNENIGLFLPAFADQRAVIGHPFETPYYEKTLQQVNSFFNGTLRETPDEFYSFFHIDYILVSKAEANKLKVYFEPLHLAFENEEYLIFKAKK